MDQSWRGTHPVHAGVDLDVDVVRGPGGGEGLDEGQRVHRRRQPPDRELVGVPGLRLAQHQDRCLDARFTEPDALLDECHGKPWCAGIERRLPNRGVAMAIAVGLDHHAQLGWGDEVDQPPDVASDGSEIDLGIGGSQIRLPGSKANLPM